MHLDTANILWGLLFGSIGFGYFIYGKKQGKMVPLGCGIALMVYPYVVENNILIVVIGAALMAVPYFIKR